MIKFLIVLASFFPSYCVAMVITFTLYWNNPLSNYNLQENSIVQIIGYDHKEGPKPNENNSFIGSPADPYSTPANHDILYQGNIENGYFSESVSVLNDYNRVYVRIFSTTDFNEEELSYWGLSNARNINHNTSVVNFNNIDADYLETFAGSYFEVIPEPRVMFLLFLGTLVMTVRRRRS